MIPIVKRLASFLQRQTGCKVTVCDALENKGVKGKSVQTKGAAQRSQRLKGHVSVRSSVSLQNTMVILVDDIVTTGATVITVLALAHTPAGKQMDEPMQAQ